TFNQTTGQIISVQSEDVWNSPPGDKQACGSASEAFPAGGTGGGVSQLVGLPSYQAISQDFLGGVPNNANRMVPDIAALAGEPTTVSFIGGKAFSFIGTSQASPLWAGMTALLNQFNGEPIGNINPLIYRLGLTQYASGSLPGSFHDITVGNNSVLPRQPCDPNGVTGYSAQFGFDLVSGWGSPDLTVLTNNAVAFRPPVITSLNASLQGNTLSVQGAATDTKQNIADSDLILVDATGAVVGETGPQTLALGGQASVSFELTIDNMGMFPTAVAAGVVLLDADGTESGLVFGDFGDSDPGGPTITNVTGEGPLLIQGTGFEKPTELEVNGVIVGPPATVKVKAGGTKLKIAGTESKLGLQSGPNRVRVIVNGLRSNIFVLTL
ncbi:MAG TPA: hypothetical protein VI756_11115, partial [Blastocatellia bacterium]